jgi:hypothetical protein
MISSCVPSLKEPVLSRAKEKRKRKGVRKEKRCQEREKVSKEKRCQEPFP